MNDTQNPNEEGELPVFTRADALQCDVCKNPCRIEMIFAGNHRARHVDVGALFTPPPCGSRARAVAWKRVPDYRLIEPIDSEGSKREPIVATTRVKLKLLPVVLGLVLLLCAGAVAVLAMLDQQQTIEAQQQMMAVQQRALAQFMDNHWMQSGQ